MAQDPKLLPQSNFQNPTTFKTQSNRCSDEVMPSQQGFDEKRTSLAAEVVSDCSPRTNEEMDDANFFKEPSEQPEMQNAELHLADVPADKKAGLCP